MHAKTNWDKELTPFCQIQKAERLAGTSTLVGNAMQKGLGTVNIQSSKMQLLTPTVPVSGLTLCATKPRHTVGFGVDCSLVL